MRIVIIEDEHLFAEDLADKLLSLDSSIEILTVLKSVRDGLDWFTFNKAPEIVFSDIRLEDGMSFEIFRQVEPGCPVVFVTAYDEYAIQAFKFNSLHYLMKPVSLDDLKEVLSKFEKYSQPSDLSRFLEMMSLSGAYPVRSTSSRIYIQRVDTIVPIETDNISAIRTEDKLVTIYLKDGGSMVSSLNMKELTSKLDPLLFKKITRQWTVNISAIEKFQCGIIGKGHIFLKPSLDVELSRDKYYEIIKTLTR